MKIQLILPTRLDANQQPIKYKKALFPPMSLAILDGLTPLRHHVKVVNDVVEEVDFSSSYDLVAITAFTAQINRAYQIADQFRKLGVKVVIGGIHATVLPHEVKEHADAVFVGEVGHLWKQILLDAEKNRLKEFYQEESLPDLKDSVLPRWDHMNMKIYLKPWGQKLPAFPIFTTRGCLYDCTFCSVSKYFGRTFRTKPIAKVIEEIDNAKANSFIFVDDNITGDADYARELFKALVSKRIRWFSQADTTILKSPDLIDMANKAGSISLLVGIESFNKKSLKTIRKGFNHPEAYGELFARLRKAHIIAIPTIIFGFDEEPLEQFEFVIDFLMKHKLGTAFFSILTPLPGTELYQEMKKTGRIITTDWGQYDLVHLVFKPIGCSVDEFHEKFWKYYRSYFTYRKMAKRLFYFVPNSSRPFTTLSVSLFYSFHTRKQVYAYNPPISDGFLRRKR
jgi:radical SAM superfamily enzyme YgiQ (UPF0313 family)